MHSRDDFADFESVEERLIEAFATLDALPDRERGWLRTRTMGLWRGVMPERVDIDCEPTPARLGVSRHAYARMEEALGWCEWLTPGARRVVGATMIATRGGECEPNWPSIRRALGEERTTDALRMAYSRALTVICNKLNVGK